MSFQHVRDNLIFCLADGVINEEEFAILYSNFWSENPCYPYWEYDSFCLDELDSSECLTEFRVAKEDIPGLALALQIPDKFTCTQASLRLVLRFTWPSFNCMEPRFSFSSVFGTLLPSNYKNGMPSCQLFWLC